MGGGGEGGGVVVTNPLGKQNCNKDKCSLQYCVDVSNHFTLFFGFEKKKPFNNFKQKCSQNCLSEY